MRALLAQLPLHRLSRFWSKTTRWIVTLLVIITLVIWSSYYGLHCRLPEEGSAPNLYANQTDDNLQRTFLKAINGAMRSIHLYIYALSDNRLIDALKKKENEGISVKVFHDESTEQVGLRTLSDTTPIKMGGLMHKKILIIDEETVWIGSANFTTASLRLHDNLVIGAICRELADTILAGKSHHHFTIGGQMAEFWSFPEAAAEGLDRLISLINEANHTIRVGMFTWTHPKITESIMNAAKRGIRVEVVVDRAQTNGANKKSVDKLIDSPVHVRINRGSELFHHKFVIIDDRFLINGSANWTKSAFGRNADCFLILHELEKPQQKKLQRLWHVIRATSDRALPIRLN